MKWDELSMAERARYIKMGVDSGMYDLKDIRNTYNNLSLDEYKLSEVVVNKREYGGRVNKFDGKSTRTNQMRRVEYKDPTTGRIYDHIPEGFTTVNNLSLLTPEALDQYRQLHPAELDEVYVTAKSPNRKSTTMGAYYDRMRKDPSTDTEQNMFHRAMVDANDTATRETAAFEKPMNFLSPGQWYGALVDKIQGEKDFWEGIYDGNSGWVSDEFAKNNPRASVLVNMAGDAVAGYMGDLTFRNIKTGVNRYNYERNLYNNIDNFNSITPDDISRLVLRQYPYTHEQINPFTSNSKWGRKFRYNIGKMIYKGAELPTVYRKLKFFPKFSFIIKGDTGGIQMSNPWPRWFSDNEGLVSITNTTTDVPVRPHRSAKLGWKDNDTYAVPGIKMLDYDLWSTRPSDTFAVNENVQFPVDKTKVFTGNPESIVAARSEGMNVETNQTLLNLYKQALKPPGLLDRITKADYAPYASEVQRLVTSMFGRPTAKDYRLMDFTFRPVFKSNVLDRALFTDPLEGFRSLYNKMPEDVDPFRVAAFEDDWLNSNVLYDSSTPIESALRGILGLKGR